MNIGRAVALAGIIGALIAASGCSAGRDATPSAAPEPGTTRSPQAQAVLPVLRSSEGMLPLRWSITTSASDSDRIGIAIPPSNCITAEGVIVEESPSVVSITAMGTKLEEPCTQQNKTLVGYVELSSPLGHRVVRGQEP